MPKKTANPKAPLAAASEPADKLIDEKDPNTVTVGKPSTPGMKEIGGSEFELWNAQLLVRTYTTLSPKQQAHDADAMATQKRNACSATIWMRGGRRSGCESGVAAC